MRQPAALSKDISSGWDLSSSQQEVEVALPRESVFCLPLPQSFHHGNPLQPETIAFLLATRSHCCASVSSDFIHSQD